MQCFVHASHVNNCCLEVVRHVSNTFCSDNVYIRIVCLILRKLSVDKTLRDVKHDTVFKGTMYLQPPRVLVIPHSNALSMIGLEFATSIPSSHIYIMHATVVKARSFRLMPFTRSQAWRHVTNTENSQIT